jgi:hypothetical protein
LSAVCTEPLHFHEFILPTGHIRGRASRQWGIGNRVASVTYTGAQILAVIGSGPLLIGLDINQANDPQTLTSFTMTNNTTHVVDSTASAMSVPAGNNGNGYADYLLAGFSSFAAGDSITFHFVFSDANDGTENLFLIGGTPTTPTPEPVTLALTGSGLVGLFLFRKRFAKR